MPRSDVLDYARQKDPRFKDVPDADLAAYLTSTHPEFAKELSGFSKPKGQTASQRESKRRIANIGVEQAAAEQKQGDINAKTEFAGRMAEVLPLAVAAPFTGGMSLLPAMATMGAANLSGGIIREGIKAYGGSSDIPKSKADLALSLGIDFASGAVGEAGIRGVIGAGKAIGGKILPQMIERAAAKSIEGARLLEDTSLKVGQQLSRAVGRRPVDITKPLTEAYDALNAIPKAAGKVGEKFTGLTSEPLDTVARIKADLGKLPKDIKQGKTFATINDLMEKFAANPKNKGVSNALMDQVNKLPRNNPVAASLRRELLTGELAENRSSGVLSDKAEEIMGDIEEKMAKIGGKIASHQPLDGLIEMKGSLQRKAWEEPSLSHKERVIFKQTAEKLDRVIKTSLKQYGPEVEGMYARFNDLMKTQQQRQVTIDLAEGTIKRLLPAATGRAIGGGAIGGAVGYEATHSWKGAAAGAVAGTAANVAIPKLAALVLEQTLKHPEGARLLSKAVDIGVAGSKPEAVTLAARAFKASGGIETIKKYGKEIYLTLHSNPNQQPPQ